MMRPMKLAGRELLFGHGCLEHLKTLKARKVVIVLSSARITKTPEWKLITAPIEAAGIEYSMYIGVEPDPHFSTVRKGAEHMLAEKPDFILAVGGGSVMDAAKTMWVLYEHPEIDSLAPLKVKEGFPKLRKKAFFGCIPTTAGSASEVSRSVVITDDETGYKHGIGNMEMMPDLALCDPVLTVSMPRELTATTGMDALTHAVEAVVSNRANYVSDTLARRAVIDIFEALPDAVENGTDMEARERMLNASMTAGLAFTNVSLGIVHSIAHSCGSLFGLAHGKTNAVVLPYVVEYNGRDPAAKQVYQKLAEALGAKSFVEEIRKLNSRVGIPESLGPLVTSDLFEANLEQLIDLSLADGCTKTNPIIPSRDDLRYLLRAIYNGG